VTTALIAQPLRFPGQYEDAGTGLHYNWHRYYEPETGRYLRSDPIGLADGFNTYAYVNNNPLTWIDIFGLEAAAPAIPNSGAVLRPSVIPRWVRPPNPWWLLIWSTPAGEGSDIVPPAPYYNEGSSGDDSCPVPDTFRDRITKGNTDIRTKPGNTDTANGDFDALNPTGVSDKGNGVRVGTLEDGRTVIVRPSTEGRPTIEIQSGGRTRIKIRYGQ
jgi:RHS repeat-associated protein